MAQSQSQCMEEIFKETNVDAVQSDEKSTPSDNLASSRLRNFGGCFSHAEIERKIPNAEMSHEQNDPSNCVNNLNTKGKFGFAANFTAVLRKPKKEHYYTFQSNTTDFIRFF